MSSREKRKALNCLTINTDASYSHKYKVGTYAFYIVCDLFKIQKSGYFKVKPKSPMDAEMMCMANALATLNAQKELPVVKLIIINSDCLYSFEKIGLKKKNETGRVVAKQLQQVRNKMAFRGVILPKFDFRHVKAHNGTPDARSYVNDWCDREAKKWMGYLLNKLKEDEP